MRTPLLGAAGSSLAVFLLVAASPGQAQTARPWVDPPPDAGSASSSSSPAQAPVDVTSPASPASPAAAHTEASTRGETKAPPAREASASKDERSASKAVSRKGTSATKTRQRARAVAARSDRARKSVQRRDYAGQVRRGSRAEQIRDGMNSGLEVMTLRTIEFPDGRRVQILTRPRPGAVSELMAAPY